MYRPSPEVTVDVLLLTPCSWYFSGYRDDQNDYDDELKR